MKTLIKICLISFCVFIVSCKAHPYFSQSSSSDNDINRITYCPNTIFFTKKEYQRLKIETEEMMRQRCGNYKFIKWYSTRTQSTYGSAYNSQTGATTTYGSSGRTYYHFEFNCARSEDNDSNYVRNDVISMAFNNRGWQKYKKRKYYEALQDFNKAIELDNKNSVAYDSRAETKYAMEDYSGCLEDCDIAISINSRLANSYLFRGKVYFRNGENEKACSDWNYASQLGKKEAYELLKKNCK